LICKNCGKDLLEDVKYCPNCGTSIQTENSIPKENITIPQTEKIKNKINKKNGCFGCLGLMVIFIIILALIGTPSDKNKSTPIQSTTASTVASTPSKPPEKIENWQYSEKDDTIHNAKIKFARTTSLNTLNFKFPYNGSQHGSLIVRKNYDGSKDAMLVIDKGQFMTSVLGGKALVRFDDSSSEEFQLLSPQDNSTTTVFFKYADNFIEKLSKSKKVYIQTSFYQEGNPTLEFNVEGLKEL
jgi:RNA polymerase subunit RPABC4/transcription elongation factor Spt4